jgi:hypothetical protein
LTQHFFVGLLVTARSEDKTRGEHEIESAAEGGR